MVVVVVSDALAAAIGVVWAIGGDAAVAIGDGWEYIDWESTRMSIPHRSSSSSSSSNSSTQLKVIDHVA